MLRRKSLPDCIVNAPNLFLGNEVWYAAFLDLNADREMGWGAGPIRWTAIRDYAEAWDLDLDDLEFFVRAMDKEYLAIANKPKP
ncbi:MAG: hypothetical protein EHM35_01240 [Planctomycetaceae bacterium]|nr:MAG: hypothetical protein EHM35_01240 [Planctomycetaceae bacterium]